MSFLGNLVKVFPSLATRPLYLTGESYAGQYIVHSFYVFSCVSTHWHICKPYILKAYFDMSKPPVSIAKIAIGDGTYSSEPIFELLPAVCLLYPSNTFVSDPRLNLQLSMLETYPQLIGYDQDVYNYFKAQ